MGNPQDIVVLIMCRFRSEESIKPQLPEISKCISQMKN